MDFEKEYYENEGFWSEGVLLDDANKERIEITIKSIPKGVLSIADIGCGNGVFLNAVTEKKMGYSILGVDRSETALKYVKCHKMLGSIDELPLAGNSYDCVTCLEVIEHLPVPIYKKSLRELARVSKEYIIISTPYNEILEEGYNLCPSCKTIFNVELHLRSFSKEDMTTLFDEFGFECIETKIFGKSVGLKGHKKYRKLFYPEQYKQWLSPICPLCGYTEKKVNNKKIPQSPVKQSILSRLTLLPKLFWPKEEKNYWILGVFKKVKEA